LGAPALNAGSSLVYWDGERLSRQRGSGRRFRADPRCLNGERVEAWAHVCALADEDAALRFDEPEVQGVRRDALAWWIPLLGDELVCVTTLALDSSRYGGAITVARTPDSFVERIAGVAWPGGRFL
jgi:hypothetical protein